MKRAFSSILCCFTAIAGISAAELTPEHYDIWHAAIRSRGPDRIYVCHLIEPLEASGRITMETALRQLPKARPTADIWQLARADGRQRVSRHLAPASIPGERPRSPRCGSGANTEAR